jgi:hypothetical protein
MKGALSPMILFKPSKVRKSVNNQHHLT